MRGRWILALTLTGAAACTPAPRNAGSPADSRVTREDAYRENNLGVALLERFDYAAAAAAFTRALGHDGQLAMARHNLAVALFHDGQIRDAEAAARAAVAAMPDSPRAHYVLGLVARAADDAGTARNAFSRVLALDPDDAGANIQLGQTLASDRQYIEAISHFERASRAEPFNATAAYGLATALARSDRATEAKTAMTRFERLRDDAAAVTYSNAYLQQGRHGEAMASTGLEPGLVDASVPEVTFQEITRDSFPRGAIPDTPGVYGSQPLGIPLPAGSTARQALARAATSAPGVTLADLDRDDNLDLIAISERGVRIYRGQAGRFATPTDIVLTGTTAIAAVVGDLDNDQRPDLFVLGYPEHRVLRQTADGTFTEGVARARLPATGALARTAALADLDHDGDLDAVIAGLALARWQSADTGSRVFPSALAPASIQLLRNNANGTFTDVSVQSGLADRARSAIGLVTTDFDSRRDLDLLVVPFGGVPALFMNQRDGTFRDLGPTTGLPAHEYTAVAAGDVNKDRVTDLFLARAGAAGLFAMSDARGGFTTTPAPDGTADARAAQLLDYDNDGVLDLLVLGPAGPRLFQYAGSGWSDATGQAFSSTSGLTTDPPVGVATGDLDRDGDLDLVMRLASGGIGVFRNDGGNRHPSLRVRLTPRVSNRSAAGAIVELRAGSLYQRVETAATTPGTGPVEIIFGLGSRTRTDVVRVAWPAGILQAETDVPPASPGSGSTLAVEELDRKPSSCPYLYAWNGSRFEFVTDFLGGGEVGYWISPGTRNVPDPDEYVRIPPGTLVAREGRYELRVTNELEEAVFLDRLQLVAVDHPAGTNIYPNEGLRSPAAAAPFQLYTVEGAQAPARATDHVGRDVRDRLLHADHRYVDGFPLEPVQGYAKAHSLTLAWDAPASDARTMLLLEGWTDYAFSSDNVAAHQAGLVFQPPALQLRDEAGRWHTVVAEVGIPVGRPQTIAIDLTDALAVRDHRPGASSKQVTSRGRAGRQVEVRIVTTLRIYWDRIQVATSSPVDYRLSRLDPLEASLRQRGFSTAKNPGAAPLTFDYDHTVPESPWKTMPGRYTREGDVMALLLATDDRYVILAPGDEIAVSFAGPALPTLPPGWTRTFLLYSDGFSKEMNMHSSSPDRLEPLPFHGMSDYPYPPSEHYPRTPEHDRYRAEYNTRVIGGPFPALERILLPKPAARPDTTSAKRSQ